MIQRWFGLTQGVGTLIIVSAGKLYEVESENEHGLYHYEWFMGE